MGTRAAKVSILSIILHEVEYNAASIPESTHVQEEAIGMM
jgi:hypothetical protein